jgi:hypothetical protein
MEFSVQSIEQELRTLLRGGIRTAFDQNGLVNVDEKVASIFEQLALIMLLNPESIYTLFGKYVSFHIDALNNLLEEIRLFYHERYLAGLPAQTDGSSLSIDAVVGAERSFFVYNQAVAGTAPSSRDVETSQQAIQTCIDELLPNVNALTKRQARSTLIAALNSLETFYERVSWQDLEAYVEKFDRSALSSATFYSLAARIRHRLQKTSFDLYYRREDARVAISDQVLVVMATAKRILELLTDFPDVDGSVVVPPFEDMVLVDDDLIVRGISGQTHPLLLVLDGTPSALLKVTAQPLSASDPYTRRVGVTLPVQAALSFSVEVVEEPLISSTFESVPDQKLAGSGATPIAPFPTGGVYGPHLQHVGASFLANGVESGDRLYQSAAGATYNGYWETVLSLPSSNPHELLDIVDDHFEDGTSVTYYIYAEATNILRDTEANFGFSLLGARIDVAGGTTYVRRVLSETELELGDAILPLRFVNGVSTPSGLDASGQKYAYAVYESPTSLGRTVQTTEINFFTYHVPPRTLFRLNDGSSNYRVSVSTIVDDRELRIREAVPPGTYTALLLHQILPGDVLLVDRRRYRITDVLAQDLIAVSPGVPSGLANARARVLPAGIGMSTKQFHDPAATFISDGVHAGHLLIVSVESSQMKLGITAVVSETTLILRQPIPADEKDLEYTIVSEDDDNTEWISTTSTSLAPAAADDVLAVNGLRPSIVKGFQSSDTLIARPGFPLITDASPALIARGGVSGYAHYALVQERLFGSGAPSWPTLENFRLQLSDVLYNLDDTGVLLLTDTMTLQDLKEGTTVTSWIRPSTWDLSGIRFGDMLYFEILDGSGDVVPFTRYIRDWSSSDRLITFFPPVDFGQLSTREASVQRRRSAVSNAFYELHMVEVAAENVREILLGLVSPTVPPLESFLGYLEEHGLQRARDLLLAADIETLAQSTGQGLSYAGRLEELIEQGVGLLGSEEDSLLDSDESW